MVIMMIKNEDYYYKNSDFIYLDDIEKMQHGYNEYGYNLDSIKRKTINQIDLITKSRTFVNKEIKRKS